MQATLHHFHHRHDCCQHHATASAHHHYLAAVLGLGLLIASLVGAVRTIDAFVWGQAYKPHVVTTTSGPAAPDAQTSARYQTDDKTKFNPVSSRIFGS